MKNMQIETVKISAPKTDDNPLGFVVYNMSDVVAGMELYVEPASAAAAKTTSDAAAQTSGKSTSK